MNDLHLLDPGKCCIVFHQGIFRYKSERCILPTGAAGTNRLADVHRQSAMALSGIDTRSHNVTVLRRHSLDGAQCWLKLLCYQSSFIRWSLVACRQNERRLLYWILNSININQRQVSIASLIHCMPDSALLLLFVRCLQFAMNESQRRRISFVHCLARTLPRKRSCECLSV
jgi:hypothetical protein